MKKKYFWLKLHEDFFSSMRIKMLEKMENGDTLIVIYLKMQLKSLKTGGYLYFCGYMDSIAEELAFEFDRKVEDVQKLLDFLKKYELLEVGEDEKEICLTYVQKLIHSETADAERMRNYRKSKEQDANNVRTMYEQCSTKSEQCSNNVTPKANNVRTTFDRDRDRDRERDRDRDIYNIGACAREDGQAVSPSPSKKFKKPTIDEVRAYCLERNNKVDPEQFVDFYTSKGWKVGKEPMKDWKAAVRTWEKRDERKALQSSPPAKVNKAPVGAQRKYDFAELERRLTR